MEGLIEKFIVGFVTTFIMLAVPKIYKYGELKKREHISQGKVYYGVFRMIGLYLAALTSGDLILAMFLGNTEIDGMIALILVLVASIPMMIIYLILYKKHYKKLIQESKKQTK